MASSVAASSRSGSGCGRGMLRHCRSGFDWGSLVLFTFYPYTGLRARSSAVDNTLNEIRRKISLLRSQMLAAENVIRKQIDRDQDSTDTSLRLMALRTKMLELIADR